MTGEKKKVTISNLCSYEKLVATKKIYESEVCT